MITAKPIPAGSTGPDESAARARVITIRDVVAFLGLAVVTGLIIKSLILDAVCVQTGSMEGTLLPGDDVLVNKFVYGARTPDHLPWFKASIPALSLPSVQSPSIGDVVIFRFVPSDEVFPDSQHPLFIKRIIGCPGDTVQILHGKVLVNGRHLTIPEAGRSSHEAVGEGARPAFPDGSVSMSGDFDPIVVPGRGVDLILSEKTQVAWRRIIEGEGHSVSIRSGLWFVDGTACGTFSFAHQYYFVLGDHRSDSYDSRFFGPVRDDALVGKIMLVFWSRDENQSGQARWYSLANIRWQRVGSIVR